MRFNNLLFSSIILLILLNIRVSAQVATLPSVSVKSLNGESVDTKDFGNEGKPFLIVFFTTCCSPSLNAMNGISDNIEGWQTDFGLKVIAISIDDSRNSRKVAPLAKGKGWGFDIYLDENSDFKRAMGVNNKPHYILFDGKSEIKFQRSGYIPGIEEEIQNELEKIGK